MLTQSDIELLERYVDGTLAESDASRLRTLLRGSREARAMLRSMATMDFGLQDIAARGDVDSGFLDGVAGPESPDFDTPADFLEDLTVDVDDETPHSKRRLLAPVLTAVAAVAVLSVILVLTRKDDESSVAKIVGVTGDVQWTMDSGRVDKNLSPERPLGGGTLKSNSADATVALAFPDGTTVTLAGLSELQLPTGSQKTLRLERGTLFASVEPQPEGEPMRIDTPTARLEVLGTRFSVQVDEAGTLLVVDEGLVRAERAGDGSAVDVTAGRQVVLAVPEPAPEEGAGRMQPQELRAERHRVATRRWRPALDRTVEEGVWNDKLAPQTERDIRQRVAEMVAAGVIRSDQAEETFRNVAARFSGGSGRVEAAPARGSAGSFFVVSLVVSRAEHGRVVLDTGSEFRVRGALRGPTEITIGFSALAPDESRIEQYSITRRVDGKDGRLDLQIAVDEFRLAGGGQDAPASGLELVRWWCSSGLAWQLDGFELVPSR